ncbi:TIGR04002 family protein [Ruminococcus sp. AF14-10]|nr:TIGR04002 family protein [Ruminococcus sp. AF14-10]
MNKRQQTLNLTMTGVFAAMITIMTAYICHVPYGANGGYIHFGDALIYVAAVFLPRPYAMAAAAIGGGMADLLTAPLWAPATIMIKMIITLPFTSKEGRILCPRNIIAPFLAALLSATGYYLAQGILFGSFVSVLASFAGSAVQSGGSAIIFLALAVALDKAHMKSRTEEWLGLPIRKKA